ncbi:unnamed protein product [Lampetra fluviatilis]
MAPQGPTRPHTPAAPPASRPATVRRSGGVNGSPEITACSSDHPRHGPEESGACGEGRTYPCVRTQRFRCPPPQPTGRDSGSPPVFPSTFGIDVVRSERLAAALNVRVMPSHGELTLAASFAAVGRAEPGSRHKSPGGSVGVRRREERASGKLPNPRSDSHLVRGHRRASGGQFHIPMGGDPSLRRRTIAVDFPRRVAALWEEWERPVVVVACGAPARGGGGGAAMMFDQKGRWQSLIVNFLLIVIVLLLLFITVKMF